MKERTQEQKFKNICEFYAVTHKLKTLIRTGWKIWGVSADRLESVAEHIYGTQMLAFAVNNEFELGLDIQKIAFMLAFHELGECKVGDITIHDAISKEEKYKLELKAVKDSLNLLSDNKLRGLLFSIFNEFEERKTKEAIFAHMIDKLECDFQVKCYDEQGFCDFELERTGSMENVRQRHKKAGDKTFSAMWINEDSATVGYDKLFKALADYIVKNKIFVK